MSREENVSSRKLVRTQQGFRFSRIAVDKGGGGEFLFVREISVHELWGKNSSKKIYQWSPQITTKNEKCINDRQKKQQKQNIHQWSTKTLQKKCVNGRQKNYKTLRGKKHS